MTLTFGVLGSIVKANKLPRVTNREIVSGFVSAIDPKEKYGEPSADVLVGKLLHCEKDFSVPGAKNARTQVVSLAQHYKDASSLVEHFKKSVVDMILPDRKRHVVFALKDVIRNDREISTIYSEVFKEKVGMSVERFLNSQSLNFAEILAGLFLFTIITGNNCRGQETAAIIENPDYWESLKPEFLILDHKEAHVDFVSEIRGVDDYKRRALEKYGMIHTVLPNKEECKFEDIYVCTNVELGWSSHETGRKIQPSIESLRKWSMHALIAAQGGNGKSMLFLYLFFTGLNDIYKLNAIPLYVCLRFYSEETLSLLTYIFSEIRKVWPELDRTVFFSLITSGRVILLLDGLDEMSNEAYRKFKEDIRHFIDMYKDIQIILSARPYMGWIDGIDHFSIARLCGLSKKQAIELINKINLYPENSERAKKFMVKFETTLWRKKREFASNPLLLMAMLHVYHEDGDVPLDGWKFFQRTFQILAVKHDTKKVGFERKYATGLTLDKLVKYLYEFAYHTYISKAWALDMGCCRSIYETMHARNDEIEPTTCDDFMVDMEKNLSIMYQESGIYNFFQHAFQEYFTACYMASQDSTWIKNKTAYFEENHDRTLNDYVFSLLYELRTKQVNESIVLPTLRSVFKKRPQAVKYTEQLTNCSKREAEFLAGYWSYVLNQYPYFEYHKEKGKDCTFVIEPKSTILEFLLHSNHYPSEKVSSYDGEVELEPKSYFHEPIDGNTIVGDEGYSDEIDYLIHGQRVHYNAQRRKYIQLYDTWGERTELSRDISFAIADVLSASSCNSDLIMCFEADNFPIMKEYIAMRLFFRKLKEERSRSIHSDV